MENIDLLKELLDAGFTAITENGVVVEKAESTDDILIENLIAKLEENNMTSYTKYELCKPITAPECHENNDCNKCILKHLNGMSFNQIEELIKRYNEVCITISDGRITDFNIL